MTTFQVFSSILTHPGRRRPNNEDYATFFEPDNIEDLETDGRVYIIADGVGGASKGERASQYAAETVLYEYYHQSGTEPDERLKRLLRQAGNKIYDFAESSEGFMRMATTMVAVVVLEDTLTVANVGDSRAYLIRNGFANQITRDHSIVEEMIRDGTMTEEEARQSKVKNRITRSLGGERNVPVDVFKEISIQTGDQILLCSDGLTRYVSDAEFAQIDLNEPSDQVVTSLINLANRRGGADNVSAILVRISEPISEDIPLIVSARRAEPVPVDWDDLPTESSIMRQPRGLSEMIWQDRRAIIFIALASVFCISLTLFGSLWFSGVIKTPNPTPNQATMQSIISTITHVPTIEPILPSPDKSDLTIISQPSLTLTETSDTNLNFTPTQSPTIDVDPQDQQFPNLPTVIPNGRLVLCEFEVIQENLDQRSDQIQTDGIADAIEIAKYKFGKEDLDNIGLINYAEGIYCSPRNRDNVKCEYDGKRSPNWVILGWTLVFPKVPMELCVGEGTRPVD